MPSQKAWNIAKLIVLLVAVGQLVEHVAEAQRVDLHAPLGALEVGVARRLHARAGKRQFDERVRQFIGMDKIVMMSQKAQFGSADVARGTVPLPTPPSPKACPAPGRCRHL